MSQALDTIVAIATPPGRGGIGVVRLSGTRAREIAEPLLRLRHPLAPSQARFGHFLDPESGEVLDEAIATFFAAPHSYTAEDVVEIALHGAPVLLQALIRACLSGGARLAEPGEFTQRAFLSGRLDLTEAEAVHDLVAATTLQQARVAAAQLGGSLSRAVVPIKQKLVELIAALEAGIDFAEDDLDLMPEPEVRRRLDEVHASLTRLLETWRYGRVLRDGFTLAIVGRPNAGKSSLFNRLLGRDRAIVTAHPGTTRDPIHERLALGGIPVELIDTAGLREAPAGPAGEAEQQGVERSRTALAEADLVLYVLDATAPPPPGGQPDPEDVATLASLAGRPYIAVLNKADLCPGLLPAAPAPSAAAPAQPGSGSDVPHGTEASLLDQQTVQPLAVSALTGKGVAALQEAMLARIVSQPPSADYALITTVRQHTAVLQAVNSMGAARLAATGQLPHEFLLLDLQDALEALDRLTGATTADDILRLIFSTFCVGK